MPDQKVSLLTQLTTPAVEDLLYVVDDPSGTPASRYLTIDDLRPLIAGRIKTAARTAGNIVLNGTSWVDLDSGLDLVLTGVVAGDLIEVGLSGRHQNEGREGFLDVGSLVSAAIVNVWSQDGAETASSEGVSAWNMVGGLAGSIGGSVVRAVVSGDIDAGSLTLRFRARTNTAGTKTLRANTDSQLQVWAKNHGQAF